MGFIAMRYFIGFLITIGLIILLIVMLFGGGDDKKKVPTTARTLESYATTDAEASMIIDGPINAASEHEQIKISVNRNNVTFEAIKGYNGDVRDLKTFSNTEAAYDNFLSALARAGFTQGNTDEALKDEKGYCPQGNRYIFEMRQGDRSLQRFWSTSCRGPKTYEGADRVTIELFEEQVPGYEDLADNYDFEFNLL